MDNPFQALSDAFQPEYRVNLSIQRLDGSIMLTLSNERGVAAKRMITAEQRNDPKRMRRLIESIKFGMAIEQGGSAMQMLAAMTDAGNVDKLGSKPALHAATTQTAPVSASL
ncbi:MULTISPECIES: DUF3509 domain-containing protein [Pseudomonas]|uniref:DUF3509 domain-containing protein n=1 Tax=Pseudomonas TaxID=286 RepID=UPI00257FBF18|nr:MULTISPECIES: DUF3509 domain-containing protein [Pseudomonas]